MGTKNLRILVWALPFDSIPVLSAIISYEIGGRSYTLHLSSSQHHACCYRIAHQLIRCIWFVEIVYTHSVNYHNKESCITGIKSWLPNGILDSFIMKSDNIYINFIRFFIFVCTFIQTDDNWSKSTLRSPKTTTYIDSLKNKKISQKIQAFQ